MIPIKELNELTAAAIAALFNRFGEDFTSVMIDTVVPIVNAVRKSGDRAVLDYSEKFDGVRPRPLIASEEEIETARRNTPPELYNAFLKAKKNIEEFHRLQLRDHIEQRRGDGTTLGVRYQPIDSA
ncbi:MAG: hypothetical protein E4G96_09485, partial [Chrysiogenales bacterium]